MLQFGESRKPVTMDKAVQFIKRAYIRIKYFRFGWRGNYHSWQDARAACTGYDAAAILEKVKASALKVKDGNAVYERDSMLFNSIEYSWPLLANLLWIAGQHHNELSVLDVGGSLGSSYFQNRFYLTHLKKLAWSVVEQQNFVATGKALISGKQLAFYENVDEAIAERGGHQLLLMSCVLPYIEKPYEMLAGLAAREISYIIIDNTYFNSSPVNRLTIQKVPPVYYDASYPAWFLNYDEVLKVFEDKYDVIAAYNNDQFLYLEGEKIMYRGVFFRLKRIADIMIP